MWTYQFFSDKTHRKARRSYNHNSYWCLCLRNTYIVQFNIAKSPNFNRVYSGEKFHMMKCVYLQRKISKKLLYFEQSEKITEIFLRFCYYDVTRYISILMFNQSCTSMEGKKTKQRKQRKKSLNKLLISSFF